jgi:hypothetical protein
MQLPLAQQQRYIAFFSTATWAYSGPSFGSRRALTDCALLQRLKARMLQSKIAEILSFVFNRKHPSLGKKRPCSCTTSAHWTCFTRTSHARTHHVVISSSMSDLLMPDDIYRNAVKSKLSANPEKTFDFLPPKLRGPAVNMWSATIAGIAGIAHRFLSWIFAFCCSFSFS